MQVTQPFRWWHRGDLDGFFGLFVDNLIQLILIVQLCTFVLGMPDALVYGRILPGVAISLLLGNIFMPGRPSACMNVRESRPQPCRMA